MKITKTNHDEIYKALAGRRKRPKTTRPVFEECLKLLAQQQEIREQINALEQQQHEIHRLVEVSEMYICHGGEYCSLLEILNEGEDRYVG